MISLLQAAPQTDWTIASILIAGITTLAGVIMLLWKAYNAAQGKYEKRLEDNASDLVPVILELTTQAKAMHKHSQRLLEASMRLEQRRRGGTGGTDAGDSIS